MVTRPSKGPHEFRRAPPAHQRGSAGRGSFRRRDFLGVLGVAAVWPLTVSAQPGIIKRLGFPTTTSEADPAYAAIRVALRAKLADLGWVEPDNLVIDLRYADGDPDGIPASVEDILARHPDAVIVGNTPTSLALRSRTTTVPIIFVGLSDPVGTGLVKSLAHPGGNVTGFASFEFPMVGKWMELLLAVAPAITRVGILYNPETAPFIIPYLGKAQEVATALGLTMLDAPVSSPKTIEAVYRAIAARPGGGAIVVPDAYTYAQPQRAQIIALSTKLRLPAIYAFSVQASDGGLISYGPNQVDQYVRAASYLDRVFRGANPAELPVQGPTNFDLVLNLRTATAMDITVSPELLAQATQVIE